MKHDNATLRAIDASLNRATEGLRVVEDFARFVLDDALLSETAKGLRHDLGAAGDATPRDARVACRDTPGDVGTAITTAAESRRATAWDVCVASQERVQQALRSLEEFSKVAAPEAAQRFESLRYRAYTLGKALATARRAAERLSGVQLCVLLDGGESVDAFERLAASLLEAGADAIQLRDKSLAGGELAERARALVRLARRSDAVTIVNDRPDIAAAAAADGVHVGQDDLRIADARAIVGPEALVGVSTHDAEQLRRAALDGADYVGVGPTFPTPTKAFDAFPGVGFVETACRATSLPTFAIGGVTADTLPEVLRAGATRVAVASAVTAARDPAAEVRRLKAILATAAPSTVGG